MDGCCTVMMTWRPVESILASSDAVRIRSTTHFSASPSLMCSFSDSMLRAAPRAAGVERLGPGGGRRAAAAARRAAVPEVNFLVDAAVRFKNKQARRLHELA